MNNPAAELRGIEPEEIKEAVVMYCHSPLSYRECAELLAYYRIRVDHTTIYRWVQHYGKILYGLWKKQLRKQQFTDSWRMDETYVKIKGKNHYLYRAIDSTGQTLGLWLRKHRDTQAAKAFFKRLVRDHGQPRALVTDKYAATLKAVRALQEEGILPKDLEHRTVKVLNNILEQDHRLIKKRVPKSCGFQTMRTGKTTLQGIEALHALDKQSRSDENRSDHFCMFENHLLCWWFKRASSVVLKRPPKIDKLMLVSRPHHHQR